MRWQRLCACVSVTSPPADSLCSTLRSGIDADLWQSELKRLNDTLMGALPAVTIAPVVDVAQPAPADGDGDVTMAVETPASSATPAAAGAGAGAGAGAAAPTEGAPAAAGDAAATDGTTDAEPPRVVEEPASAASGASSYKVTSLYLQVRCARATHARPYLPATPAPRVLRVPP